jgi:hypothetical protein
MIEKFHFLDYKLQALQQTTSIIDYLFFFLLTLENLLIKILFFFFDQTKHYFKISLIFKVIEQEKAEKEQAAENELRARVFELERDYKNEQEKLIAITSDMTRQYKQMQDSLKKEIRVLTKTSEEKDVIISK